MPATLNYWNLDGQTDVNGDLVLFGGCPLCGNPCARGEEIKLCEADGTLGLAHAICCRLADEETT